MLPEKLMRAGAAISQRNADLLRSAQALGANVSGAPVGISNVRNMPLAALDAFEAANRARLSTMDRNEVNGTSTAVRDLHDRPRQTAHDAQIELERIHQARSRKIAAIPKSPADHEQVFRVYVRRGLVDGWQNRLERQAVQAKYMLPIQAAQGGGTGSAGGFTVPQSFADRLEIAQKSAGGLRLVASVIETERGGPMPLPTANDSSQSGARVAENAAVPTQDVVFGQSMLYDYLYSSKLITLSLQLVQDAPDILDQLAEIAGRRLARIQNADFTNGAGGTSNPQGFANATVGAPIGVTLPTGNTTSLTYAGLVALQLSVDPIYRQTQGCVFMMSDAALQKAMTILDGSNRPIFLPTVFAAAESADIDPSAILERGTLLGHRVVVNQDMAAPAANARSVAFGDFSRYYIRIAGAPTLLRLTERYADSLQVGLIAFQRADGRLVDAGTNPVKLLQQSAT